MISRSNDGENIDPNDPRLAAVLRRPARLGGVRGRIVGLALAGLLTIGAGSGVLARIAAGADAPSPATGHAEVIAHGVFDLPDGVLVWETAAVNARQQASDVPSGDEAGFLIGDDGAALVSDGETGAQTRIAAGEALVVRPGNELSVSAPGSAPARLTLLTLGQPEGGQAPGAGGKSDEFDSPGGSRDVDLVRDVLANGEETKIDASGSPIFVIVTEGSVEIEEGDSEPRELEAGDTALLTGELFVTGAGQGESSFVAAVIGPEVGESSGQPSGGQQSGGTTTQQPAAPTAIAVPNGPNDDPDGDDLLNKDEDLRGTDRFDPDSDDDGLEDGYEVYTSGTMPLDPDSDNDGLSDGDEVLTYQSNPSNQDTDNDSLLDGDEVQQYGSSPTTDDTDADMLPDPNEITNGTDPADPDTDDDNYSDHDELGVPTDPLNPDTDGDGLLDGDELLTYSTNPNLADSDADTFSDGVEVAAGTNPNDVNSHP